MKVCSIDNCQGNVLANGWCRKHYLRWYRHGNTDKIDRKITAPRGSELPQFKHGLGTHPLYCVWHSMMARCYKTKNHKFPNYGGRGIRVCDRWHDVSNFINDMSPRPKGTSIDRINNDGNYEPSNCRWANSITQARNRPQCKITDSQREEILELCKDGIARIEVARKLGLKYGDVKNTVYGHRNRLKTYEKMNGLK